MGRALTMLLLAWVVVLGACDAEAVDPRDEIAVGIGKADGSQYSACELERVPDYLNEGWTADELKANGVHAAAANRLAAHRDGEDGVFDTDDDNRFDDIGEVDGVDHVGVEAMRSLVALVEDTCRALSECSDAPVLGRPGEVATDGFDLSFAWTDGWSVAEPVTVQVPEDLQGLVVAVVAGEAETGLGRVLLDGRRLIDLERDDPNLEGVTPFFHVPVPVGAVTFPMDARTSLTPGCLTVTPVALDEIEAGRLLFVSRRFARGGAIDVNAIVVGGSGIDDAQLETAFEVTHGVFERAGGIGVGGVQVHALEWPDVFVEDEGASVNALRAAFTGEDEGRLNIYFVQDFTEPGTLGFAPGIPGPSGIHGTAASGLVISLDSHLLESGELDLTGMGETLAHEIGHNLGLFHTSESDGLGHDVFEDTPECGVERDEDGDGELTAEECLDAGAGNVMFWTSGDVRQDRMSPWQTEILSASPVVR